MSATITAGAASATADLIVRAELTRQINRGRETLLTGEFQINVLPSAEKLSGTIQYLCPDLPAALDLIDVYADASSVTLDTDELPAPVDGLVHLAIDTPRPTPDQARAGMPARWLVTVEIQEL